MVKNWKFIFITPVFKYIKNDILFYFKKKDSGGVFRQMILVRFFIKKNYSNENFHF